MNNSLFIKNLILHKKLIYKLGKFSQAELQLNENVHNIIQAKELGKELSLVSTNFVCSKCKSKNRLSFHHFIMRPYKEFMEWGRYVTSRHYWNNLLVLCWICHYEIHNINRDTKPENETEISKEYVIKLKKKYSFDTSTAEGFTDSNGNFHVEDVQETSP